MSEKGDAKAAKIAEKERLQSELRERGIPIDERNRMLLVFGLAVVFAHAKVNKGQSVNGAFDQAEEFLREAESDAGINIEEMLK